MGAECNGIEITPEMRSSAHRPELAVAPRHEHTTTISGRAADDTGQHARQRRAVARRVLMRDRAGNGPSRHFGFHSRASFCASATCAGVIFAAALSRFSAALSAIWRLIFFSTQSLTKPKHSLELPAAK
jgi:hypothetical protein